MPTPPVMLMPGAEPYPGYRLVEVLGRGAWSEVWKARRLDGTSCALKFMDCQHELAPAYEIRALQAIRALRHDHILAIDHVWSLAGYVVIVMDLMDGSLLDLLEVYDSELKQPMAPEHVCFFLTQAGLAIDFLNTRQHTLNGQRVAFRHCDVKPSNLLVLGQKIKLGDFSLSVPTTATMGPHRSCGTLAYTAPEVFQGWLSDKTDQYALAVSYYQLRTGRLPYEIPKNFSKTYVRPLPELTRVSAEERVILTRGLATVPQDRWPSCAEMMRKLSVCCAPAMAAG